MPYLTPASAVHIDRPLSNFALAYENNALIADKLSPIIPVSNKSDLYFVRNKSNAMRKLNTEIGVFDKASQIDAGISTKKYSCQNHALSGSVAVEQEINSDAPLNLRQDCVSDVMAELMLMREYRVARLYNDPTKYASANKVTLTGGSRFDDANVDPFPVLIAGRATIFRAPNTRLVAWCGLDVWTAMRNNAALRGRVVYGGSNDRMAAVLKAAVASLLEVDELIVGEAYINTANPGQADTIGRVWNQKSFGIAAVATSASTRSLHFSSTFRFLAPEVRTIVHLETGTRGSTEVIIAHSDDEQNPANDAAFLVQGAIN